MLLLALFVTASHATKPTVHVGKSVTVSLAAPVESIATVRGHVLNCRQTPSMDAPIILGLPRDAHVSVRSDKGGWRHVTTKKGKVCWVASEYLAGEPEPGRE
ncbi:MAG: SH3 domain-containing protein [Alphaproteobacteria bacterium]|nr:SH3 domain-containing protein [Alphaproteobacteria bacterium]